MLVRNGIKVLLGLFLFLACRPVLAQVHTTQNVSGVYYRVDGNQENSLYPANDAAHLYEGAVSFDQASALGYNVFGEIVFRSTNDRMVDAQGASLEQLVFGLKNDNQDYRLGNYYANFSQYSVSNALKGVQAVLGSKDSAHLTFIAGEDIARWEDLWESRAPDGGLGRYVWGARLDDKAFGGRLSYAVNYGAAVDDTSRVAAGSSPIALNVFSLEKQYVLNEYFTFKGEIATSFSDMNTRLGGDSTKSDGALKYGVDFKSQFYVLSSFYSRIGNHFATTGGFTTSDLESLGFDGIVYLPLNMKLQHYCYIDEDNLSKTMATTTRQYNPGGKLALSLPLNIDWSFGADMRKRFSVDKTTHDRTWSFVSGLGRDFKIFYSSLGYTKTCAASRVDSTQDHRSDTWSLSLTGNFLYREVSFDWNAAQDITRDFNLAADKADFLSAASLGLAMRFPSTLAFAGKVSWGDNNYYFNSNGSGTTVYLLSVSRDLLKDLSFSASFERRGYRYPDSHNDYTEKFIRGALNYKF